MALTVTVTAFQLSTTEDWTSAKFNQGFNPTISVSGALSDLSNVSTSAPANGQPLVYNTGTSKWEPGTVLGSYVGGSLTVSDNMFLNRSFF
jgi:hypothetical protein